MLRKPKPDEVVIDLRERLDARDACPNCTGTNRVERLGSVECVDCGLRLGDLVLPPIA